MNRQVRRIQKAIDELIKICDDGKTIGPLYHILDDLRSLQTRYEEEEAK